MRVPVRSLNFSRPGARHHRDNLVRVEQERTHILARVVPFAKLDQCHRSSLRRQRTSSTTRWGTNPVLASFKTELVTRRAFHFSGHIEASDWFHYHADQLKILTSKIKSKPLTDVPKSPKSCTAPTL